MTSSCTTNTTTTISLPPPSLLKYHPVDNHDDQRVFSFYINHQHHLDSQDPCELPPAESMMNQISPSSCVDDDDDDDISSSSSFVSLVSLTMDGHNNNNNNKNSCNGDSSNNRQYHTNSSVVTTTNNNNHNHEMTKALLAPPPLPTSSLSSLPPSSWQSPTSPSTLAAMGMASTLTFLVSSGARSRGLYDVFDNESGANLAAGQGDGCGIDDDDGEDAIPALDEDEEEKETKPDEEETYLNEEETVARRDDGDDNDDDESVDGSKENESRGQPEDEERREEQQGKVQVVEEEGSKTNGKGNIFQFYNPAEFEFQIHLSGHGNDDSEDGEDEAKNQHGICVNDDGNDDADVDVNGNGNDDLDVDGNVDDSEKAARTIIANASEGAKWNDVVPSIDTDGNLINSQSLAELSTIDNAHTNLMANDPAEKVTAVVPSFEDVANFATVDAIGATSKEREENSVESTNFKDCFEENDVREEFETNSLPRPLLQQPPIDETTKTAATTTTATASTSATAPSSSSTFFSSMGEWLTQLCGVGNDNHFCSYDCFDAASAENEERQSKDAESDFKSNSTIHQEGNETAKEETERPSTTNTTVAEPTQDEDEMILPSMSPESTSFSPPSSSTPMEEQDAQNSFDDIDGDGVVTVAVAAEKEEEEDMATKRGALHHSTTTTETVTNTWMVTMMKANHSRKDGCNTATADYDSNIMSREDLLTSIRHTADSHKMGKEQYLRLLSALAGN